MFNQTLFFIIYLEFLRIEGFQRENNTNENFYSIDMDNSISS